MTSRAKLKGTARVIKIPIDVASFEASARLDRANADPTSAVAIKTDLDAKVFNQSIWVGTYDKSFGNQINYAVMPEERRSVPSPKPTIQFFIAGVPVLIRGYAVGYLGTEFDITGNANPVCTNGNDEMRATLRGVVEPYAKIDAKAEVAVGVDGVAEVGLRGTLTLVRVALPFKTDISISRNTVVRLYSKQALDFELRTLDGKLSIYASVAGEDIGEAEIFRWRGWGETTRLFESRYDVGLVAAAQQLAAPPP